MDNEIPDIDRPPYGDISRDEKKVEYSASSRIKTAYANRLQRNLEANRSVGEISRIASEFSQMASKERLNAIDTINSHLVRAIMGGPEGSDYVYIGRTLLHEEVYRPAVIHALDIQNISNPAYVDYLINHDSFNIIQYMNSFQENLCSHSQQRFGRELWAKIHNAYTNFGVPVINTKIYEIFAEKHPEFPIAAKVNPLDVPQLIHYHVMQIEQLLKMSGNLTSEHFRWPS